MFLEKIREIKKAESDASAKKADIQANIKQMTAKAHEDGNNLLAKIENEANAKSAKMLKEAEERALIIAEEAKSDAKIDAVTQKVEAEIRISEAVKFVTQEIFSGFVQP